MQSSAQFLIAIGSILLIAIAADLISKHSILPRVTLLLIFGMLIGDNALGLMPEVITSQFEIFTNIALLMVGFLIGGKLTRQSMDRNLGQTLWISIFAVVITFSFVSIALIAIGVDVYLAILIGCIATATDAAATIDVISESGFKGKFANLLTAIVAVDDALGLLVFSIGIAFVSSYAGATNAQSWYITTGMATITATSSVSLNGVRNGDATSMAIMLLPSGICAIRGAARAS